MRFHTVAFGCQMNVHDAAWLDRALTGLGHERHVIVRGVEEEFTAGLLEDVDLVLIHTCTVRDKAEQKFYSFMGRLAPHFRARPGAFVAVGGCVAQQEGKKLWERFPFVRLVFGGDSLPEAPLALERLRADPGLRISLLDFSESWRARETHLDQGPPQPQAFVSIMTGCDNWCAYCIVPSVRGPARSRPLADILAECRSLVERGTREITLLGQNVNAYGLDREPDAPGFAPLLREVAGIPGLARLRFTTSHPKDLDDEVIACFGELPALCPRLHLPLQSGSDRVLAAMGRGYTIEHYHKLIGKLRQARPDIALSTDLIVGFPGETEAEFQQTLDAMRAIRFAGAFSFCYSDRSGTRAAAMPGKIDQALAVERLTLLQALQDEHDAAWLGRFVGREVDVLVEGAARKQQADGLTLHGRDPWGNVVNVRAPGPRGGDAPDWARQEARLSGMMLPARVDEARKHSLLATAAGATWWK